MSNTYYWDFTQKAQISHIYMWLVVSRESLVKQGIISILAKKNRELLRNVMCEAGFTPLRSEWWHFNLIPKAEARAKYKVIK